MRPKNNPVDRFTFTETTNKLAIIITNLSIHYKKSLDELCKMGSRPILKRRKDKSDLGGMYHFEIVFQDNLYLIIHFITAMYPNLSVAKIGMNIVLINDTETIEFHPLPNFKLEFEFKSINGFSDNDITVISGCYNLANDLDKHRILRERNYDKSSKPDIGQQNLPPSFLNKRNKFNIPKTKEGAIVELKKMGLTIFEETGKLDWDDLAGCQKPKDEIKKIIYNRINKQSIYEALIQKTHKKPNPRMPKGVLLYGPSGVGKTLSARIIASTLGVPLVVMKKSEIDSKWINEGNENITKIFKLCTTIGTIVLFIDELEQLGKKRGSGYSPYADELVSTLLTEIDGISTNGKTIILAATNIKDAIDPAFQQRFTKFIEFTNPDLSARKMMFSLYAKHLSESDIDVLAEETEGLSGRSIEYCCEATNSLILDKIPDDFDIANDEMLLPKLNDYLFEISDRRSNSETTHGIGFGAKDKMNYS